MKSREKIIIGIISMIFILTAVLLTGCSTGEKESDSLAAIKERGKFIVGLDDSFPPMGFRDEQGEIVGFDIDLAREAAKRMGVEVEFKAVEWDGVLLSLRSGEIDLIWNGLTITEPRRKEIGFSSPYLANRQIVIVSRETKISKFDDLKGKVIGLQLGSSSEIALNKEVELLDSLKEIRKYASNTEALLDLKAGRIDAVVVDEIVGRYYLSKREGQFGILNGNLGEEYYGVGVRKNDLSFSKELERVLTEMKEDGTAGRIAEKWFGADIIKQ